MVWNLVVFALIGLLVGAAARLFWAGREPTRVLRTLVLGMAGSLAAGLIAAACVPTVEGQVSDSTLLAAFLGAVLALVFWAGVGYARTIGLPPPRRSSDASGPFGVLKEESDVQPR
jgi:uncharacterized membrane protein YeaQ/YmgE (transglycosylase-associated protein family)